MALIMVLPRLTGAASLHPGEDGNPAFSSYDLDSNLRMVFYPACAGWIITGIWIYNLHYRISKLKNTRS
jgi:heme exporter protein C